MIESDKRNYLFYTIVLISFLSALRNLFLPSFGDELTYLKITENILTKGQYFLDNQPSSVTPSIPFFLSVFYNHTYPEMGILLARLANLALIIYGFRFVNLFLENLNLSRNVRLIIILLSLSNANMIYWSTTLYPESILFLSFWIFIYYITKLQLNRKDFFILVISLLVLSLTRYVFAVLGLLLLIRVTPYLGELFSSKKYIPLVKFIIIVFIISLPSLIWFKYIYAIESQNSLDLSYFNRFKERDLFYNIKAGLGLIQHENAGQINGIPAFISLFIPMTGLRSWILSIFLLISFTAGFLFHFKDKYNRYLFFAILLVMSGLVFAGTGFSRYWLIMLPGYIIGFYYFFKKFGISDKVFIMGGQFIALIYVINEIRLNIKIFTNLL